MPAVRDQLLRQVELATPPRRIVSLCPSVTETLFALGLGESLVGRTNFCCHPAGGVTGIARVGGTKDVRIDAIAALAPDLIVAVREENRQDTVNELAGRWPVIVLGPETVDTALAAIRLLGDATDRQAAAEALAVDIAGAFGGLPSAGGVRVVYLIWRRPYMAAGRATYIDDVLTRLGLVNVARALEGRYPEVAAAAFAALRPQLVLVSSEPFPFRARHADELRALAPAAEPVFVDGEMFSWHGARMLAAAHYFKRLIPQLTELATLANA